MIIDRSSVPGYSKELTTDKNRITDHILVPFMSEEFASAFPFFPKESFKSNGRASHPRYGVFSPYPRACGNRDARADASRIASKKD